MDHNRQLFRSTITVHPMVIVLCLIAHALLKWWFFSSAFQNGVAASAYVATLGLVTPVLLAGLIEWLVLVIVVMGLIGQMKAADLGFERQHALPALVVLGSLWLMIQLGTATLGHLTLGGVSLARAPLGHLPLEAFGIRLQALFGSGLIEEVLYRGFLLTQCYMLLARKFERASVALTAAICFSAIYFGLNHIPAGMRMGLGTMDIVVYVGHVTLVGALFGTLFLRTGNLLIAGGAHALINDPFALFAAPVDPALLALIGVAGLLLLWPLLSRHVGPMFSLGVLEGRPAI